MTFRMCVVRFMRNVLDVRSVRAHIWDVPDAHRPPQATRKPPMTYPARLAPFADALAHLADDLAAARRVWEKADACLCSARADHRYLTLSLVAAEAVADDGLVRMAEDALAAARLALHDASALEADAYARLSRFRCVSDRRAEMVAAGLLPAT